ncbi:hypothetical protein MLD52_22765 [Puniceicoccaceae bacterium K14]|nr:hypothetical protein [Puniceicoccaceae bacterium K14]
MSFSILPSYDLEIDLIINSQEEYDMIFETAEKLKWKFLGEGSDNQLGFRVGNPWFWLSETVEVHECSDGLYIDSTSNGLPLLDFGRNKINCLNFEKEFKRLYANQAGEAIGTRRAAPPSDTSL